MQKFPALCALHVGCAGIDRFALLSNLCSGSVGGRGRGSIDTSTHHVQRTQGGKFLHWPPFTTHSIISGVNALSEISISARLCRTLCST